MKRYGSRRIFTAIKYIISRYNLSMLFKMIIWYFEKYILRKTLICRKIQDNKMYLEPRLTGISKALAVWGIREPDHTLLFKEEVKAGMVMADIGAHIGYYALMGASIIGERGKVYALEPDPRNFKVLEKNIKLNGFDSIVETYCTALSDKQQRLKLHIAERDSNSNTALDPARVQGSDAEKMTWSTLEVENTTLDDFLRNKRTVDFVRMDIEGFEVEVFKGMMETVKMAPPKFKILFELHMHTYYHTEKNRLEPVLRDLFRLGLKAKVLIATDIQPGRYRELGYKPNRVIRHGLYNSGFYYNVKEEDVVQLTCYWPNSTQYMLLEK